MRQTLIMVMIEAHGCSLYAESFGERGDPPILLISGLTSQLTSWPEAFCEALVDRGFFVIRFDNRDVGLSTKFSEGDTYTLGDMADDCVAVLNHFDAKPAHVVGMSMGGMVAQQLVIDHPESVLSLTSYASRTGHPDFGNPSDEVIEVLLSPEPTTREAAGDLGVRGRQTWGTPETWDEQEWWEFSAANFDRSPSLGAGLRQYNAIVESGNRDDALAKVDVPTMVLHGSIDPLIPPSGGKHTAEVIANASYVEIEGMGHDLPITEWPRIVHEITAHAVRAASSGSAATP